MEARTDSIQSKRFRNETISSVFREYFEIFYNSKHEKTKLNRYVDAFSADYDTNDTNNILDIHR